MNASGGRFSTPLAFAILVEFTTVRRWRNWQTHQLEVLAPKRHRGSSPLFRTKSLVSWSARLNLESSFQDEYPPRFCGRSACARVRFSDRCCPPAAGPLGRSGRRLRWPGLTNRLRPSRSGERPHTAHHMVGDPLHVYLDRADRTVCTLRNGFTFGASQLQIRSRLRPSQARQVEHNSLVIKELQMRMADQQGLPFLHAAYSITLSLEILIDRYI